MGQAAALRYNDLGAATARSLEAWGPGAPLEASQRGVGLCGAGAAVVYAEAGSARDLKTAEAFFRGAGCGTYRDTSDRQPEGGGSSTTISSTNSTTSSSDGGGTAPSVPYTLVTADAEFLLDQGAKPRGANGECTLLGEAEVCQLIGAQTSQL